MKKMVLVQTKGCQSARFYAQAEKLTKRCYSLEWNSRGVFRTLSNMYDGAFCENS